MNEGCLNRFCVSNLFNSIGLLSAYTTFFIVDSCIQIRPEVMDISSRRPTESEKDLKKF